MQEVSQIQRQQYILSVLANCKKEFTIKDIIRYVSRAGYEVSDRTIARDIDALSLHFPISEEKKGRETYYSLVNSIEGIVELNIDELITIQYLLDLVRTYGSKDLEKSAEVLINKIMRNLTSDKKFLLINLRDAVRVEPDMVRLENELDVEMLSQIRESIADQTTIEIEYRALMNDEITRRRVDPYFLELSEGSYKIVGLCHLRNEKRAFNVSRVISLKPTQDKFEKPENFYENYTKMRFNKLTSNTPATFKFRIWGNAAKLINEYEKRRANKITENDDGSIIFEREAALTDDVIMWVLSYGDEIEVLEPKELRKTIREKALGIIKNNRENI